MRSLKTEGIVIKRRNFGEADRILTVFSPKLGKIQIKAPGVRRITSKRGPHIELLNSLRLTLYLGKNLPVLIEAEAICSFSELKKDLRKMGTAYHLCELIDKLCPENQENKEIYKLLSETLESLGLDEDGKGLVEDFELKLLILLGFCKPNLETKINTTVFIERILESKLKSRQVMQRL